MSAKKKINQRTRLLIWRAVRRKVKMAIDLPPHRRSSEGLCNFLWNETTSRGLTLNEFPSNLAKKNTFPSSCRTTLTGTVLSGGL